jgi:hypothetical protein
VWGAGFVLFESGRVLGRVGENPGAAAPMSRASNQ